MKRPTEAQAAKIETRIESLRAAGRHDEADRLQREYWDACGLRYERRNGWLRLIPAQSTAA